MTTNTTNIPAPRVPFVDLETGLVSREWFRFLSNLFNLTGGGTNVTSLTDIQYAPAAAIGEKGATGATGATGAAGAAGTVGVPGWDGLDADPPMMIPAQPGLADTHISSSVTAQTVTTAAGNLTSIALTAGAWNVAAVVESAVSGTNTYLKMGISQTSATFTGTEGKDYIVFPGAGAAAGAIPNLRVTLASAATVYLVALAGVATITTGVQGYISAQRMS